MRGWKVVAALVVTALVACSSPTIKEAPPGTDDGDAGLVARDYVRALAVGQSESQVQLDDAYSKLLPGQRAAIDRNFYTGCVLQEENQGNQRTAQVRKVQDNGDDVVPAGYSHSLPTKTVFVTLPDDYDKAPDWYGKVRVSKDAGHWYVSVAAPAFQKYGEGNCEYSIWEYPEPPPSSPVPPLPTPMSRPADTRP